MIKDLTVGNPRKVIWAYSLPLLGSVAFQQLYNIVDGVVAGRFIGDDALAAVGASYPITMIFMAVALGMNSGCSVLVSQKFGAKKIEEMKTSAYTSLITATGVSILLTIFGLIFCNQLMHMVSTPANIFADSTKYLRIYLAGLLFVFLYNICNGIFSALGDSTTPFIFLVCSSLGNIGLDILFVVPFKMGVAGVAWATFTAQGIAAVVAFFVLLRRLKSIQTEKFDYFSRDIFKKLWLVSLPSILQQSCVSVGNMFVQNLVNGFGSVVIAGYSSAIKLNTFALMIFYAFTTSLTTYCAQNFGAKKEDRIREGLKSCWLLTLLFVIPFSLAYTFLGRYLMQIFVPATSEDVIHVGMVFLRFVGPFYIVVCTKVIYDSVLRGAAAMKYYTITTFADLIVRIILANIFSRFFDDFGIWMSWPFGWSLGAVLSLLFYFKADWRHKHLEL